MGGVRFWRAGRALFHRRGCAALRNEPRVTVWRCSTRLARNVASWARRCCHARQGGALVSAAHTPGPWSVINGRITEAMYVASPDGIVAAWDACRVDPQTRRDAKLIAAAPELLEEARRVAEYLQRVCITWPKSTEPLELRGRLLATIAKAEGREPDRYAGLPASGTLDEIAGRALER
jgi:hypothetical protein